MRCCPTTTPMVVGSKLLCADRSFPEDVSECNLHSRPSTAPLNVSAYAEAGPWYVLFATLACGGVFGGLAALARDRSPLSIAVVIVSCVYAYYATQTSFTGSLVDAYGLVWLLLPVVAMVAIHKITSRKLSSSG